MGRILILGSTGQLGVELTKELSGHADLLALSRSGVDLTDDKALRATIRSSAPVVIVNAAAYTAVDRAEMEPDLARAVNGQAPKAMAEEALALNAWLLHFSTDYVFDGSGDAPWRETDAPKPLNVYGKTKLEGERAIAATGCRHLIFRTSWVYSSHGNNFLRTMLRLAGQRSEISIVNDQIGAPTSAIELARTVRQVLARLEDPASPPPAPGIYHMTCRGSTSWFGFAHEIFVMAPSQYPVPELVPISSDRYMTSATRPHNSVLSCEKLERGMGIRLAGWQDALREVMDEIAAASAL